MADSLQLEAESDGYANDTDSAISVSTSIATSTKSIGSSIMKYHEENGRTYHAYKEGKYVLPNDEEEMDRLDLQHHQYSITYDGNLFIAPIDMKNVHQALDVGTGTGIWAVEFADQHPETKVLGVDLSPIQPVFVPPNMAFEIDDLEEPWMFTEKFDYIHSRMMTIAIKDWPKFFGQAFENLSPGGWIELTDVTFPVHCNDNSMGPESAMLKWSQLMLNAGRKIGRNLDSATTYKDEMARVGFIDIVEKQDTWPTNRWPKDKKYKELGMWGCENLTTGLSGLSLALFTRVLGMSAEEMELFLIDVRNEMKDTKIHAYFTVYTVYAKKLENEDPDPETGFP